MTVAESIDVRQVLRADAPISSAELAEFDDAISGASLATGLQWGGGSRVQGRGSRAGKSSRRSAFSFSIRNPQSEFRNQRSAAWASLGRRVALKVLPFAAVLDPRQLQRFKNEAQAAAQLHHTNILPVYGVTKDSDGLPLVFMKAIECVPWTEMLERAEVLIMGHQCVEVFIDLKNHGYAFAIG